MVGITIILMGHIIFISIALINGIVVVPNHKGDIPIGTLNSILKQANIKLK